MVLPFVKLPCLLAILWNQQASIAGKIKQIKAGKIY
jgi:hypothetical protein